jgi:acid phosphatase
MPISEGLDTLLLRGEVAAWETSDKTPRRQAVAASHRVLMMFGDNMGDFTAASDGTVAERDAFAAAHRDWWGTRWITLANPTYGSFIDAVLGEATGAPWEQQVQRKKQALDPKR